MSRPTASRLIVLVHGTIPSVCGIRFFTNITWVQPGSAFRRELADAVPDSRCEIFHWSGLNSHAARETAGRDLANRIAALAEEVEHLPILLVAHSHGGNVALYATRGLSAELRSRIAGIVTLGTPFIWLHEHWSDAHKRTLMRGVLCGAAAWTILAFATMVQLRSVRLPQLPLLVLAAGLWILFGWLRALQGSDWDAAVRDAVSRLTAARVA